MKEKIMNCFGDKNVKMFTRRVINKNNLLIAIIILVVVLVLKVSFSIMFEIKGTVKSIDGENITIVNFLTTKTVDVGNYPIELKQIQVGDRIEITKNLSGDILSIKDEDEKHRNENSVVNDGTKQKIK